MRTINQIIIHCSATYPDMDIGSDVIRQWHTVDNGWSDIGYHHVISRDGTIEPGRPHDRPGAHAKGHNTNSIGICMVGGKAKDGRQTTNFTAAQWNALEILVMDLLTAYPNAEVIGHNDVSSKDCPTFDVKSWVSEIAKVIGD